MRSVDEPVRILKPVHGGACLAFVDGKTVFVRHAIEGELVRIRPTRVKRNVMWADAVDVLEPSSQRISHVWPEAGVGGVGGAELGHISAAGAREWKRKVVGETLARVGSRSLADSAPEITVHAAPSDVGSVALQWRQRVELTIDAAGLAGMHVAGSGQVRAIRDLPIATRPVNSLGLLGPDSPWREMWRPGERIRAWGSVLRIGDKWFDSDMNQLKGECYVYPEAAGFKYRVRADDFWQAHVDGANVLARRVGELARGRRCLELFCGSGLFTKVLAGRASVVAVEGARSAVESARHNTGGNVDVRLARVDANLIGQLGHEFRPDLVVLDPPRVGLGQSGARALATVGAERIVYIACDPAAFARDAEVLRQAGYKITQLECHDLFPHTCHVETLGVFERSIQPQ